MNNSDYQKPVMQVFNIKTRRHFLIGSNGVNSVNSTAFRSDIVGANSNVASRARGIDSFDEDEE